MFARNPSEIERRIQISTVAWPNFPSEWLEARAWIWLHYAITKLNRGELYEAIGMLGFFREQVIGPMLYRRAGLNQRGVRRLEALHLDKDGKLAATVARHDTASVKAALMASIHLYLDLRDDDFPSQPRKGMPELLLEILMNEPEQISLDAQSA